MSYFSILGVRLFNRRTRETVAIKGRRLSSQEADRLARQLREAHAHQEDEVGVEVFTLPLTEQAEMAAAVLFDQPEEVAA